MLKTVSSITNALGSLNYKGTWNASTNTPALASGVGTKGDYYVVSVAGSTALDGISNWGVGDWVTYNGSVWQRVEGGADLNGVNLSVSGTSTLSNLTASTALALNASKEIVSVTNTGTGDNVLATSPTLVTPTLGAATATSINKVAFTAPATSATLTIADGKTLTANRSLTLTGTDATTMTFPTTNATIARTDATQSFTGQQNIPVIASVNYASTANFIQIADTNFGLNIGSNGVSNTCTAANFNSNFGATVGSITVGATTSFNNSSDYRLKQNVQPMTGRLQQVMQLRPVTYNWKFNDSPGEGFIAHELAEVCPFAVTGEKDAVNEDGSIKSQGVDPRHLVPILTAAIQEQQAQIEQLKADMAVLKGV